MCLSQGFDIVKKELEMNIVDGFGEFERLGFLNVLVFNDCEKCFFVNFL